MSDAVTVANNALAVAQAAGLKTTILWTNPSPTEEYGRKTVTLTTPFPASAKAVIATFKKGISLTDNTLSDFCMVLSTKLEMTGYSVWSDGDPIRRAAIVDTQANTLYTDFAYTQSSGSTSSDFIIPYQIIAVEW